MARLWFGKHAGRDISEVPYSYVAWLSENAFNLRVKTMADIELRRRGESEDSRTDPLEPRGRIDIEIAQEIISAGRTALSKKFHPDKKDGDLRIMQLVNATADALREHFKP